MLAIILVSILATCEDPGVSSDEYAGFLKIFESGEDPKLSHVDIHVERAWKLLRSPHSHQRESAQKFLKETLKKYPAPVKNFLKRELIQQMDGYHAANSLQQKFMVDIILEIPESERSFLQKQYVSSLLQHESEDSRDEEGISEIHAAILNDLKTLPTTRQWSRYKEILSSTENRFIKELAQKSSRDLFVLQDWNTFELAGFEATFSGEMEELVPFLDAYLETDDKEVRKLLRRVVGGLTNKYQNEWGAERRTNEMFSQLYKLSEAKGTKVITEAAKKSFRIFSSKVNREKERR